MLGGQGAHAEVAVEGAVRCPDFFIVGHKKCGTTALHAMLRGHPQIFMPRLKEPHFLATDRKARFENPRGQPLPETLEEYGALFDDAQPGELLGEASASYLWSRTAAARIAELQPAAKIIAIFREPASFLRSKHLQYLRIHFEDEKDLGRALALEPERRAGRRIPDSCPYPQMLLYSDHVRYVEQLRRYYQRFPSDRVLPLVYDDFRSDNEATVRVILRFLEVDEDHPIEALDVNATTRSMRSQRADDLVHSVALGRGPVARAARTAVKVLLPRRLRRDAFGVLRRRLVYSDPPAPDEDVMLAIRRRFKDEVVAFSEYIERDLVGLWGYDRV